MKGKATKIDRLLQIIVNCDIPEIAQMLPSTHGAEFYL